jgi:Protein tyrosine/serine phosphatase
MGKRILFEEICNFRDLGDLNTLTQRTTTTGKVFRSSMLFGPTTKDLSKIKDLKIQTIIDLRAPSELIRTPNPYQEHVPHYVSINLSGNQDKGRAAELSKTTTDPFFMSQRYQEYVKHGQAEIAKLFRFLLDDTHYPVVIHCSAGKDRTGVIVYLLLQLQGVLLEEIIADYQVSFSFIQHEPRILKEKQLLNVYQSYPEIMQRFHEAFIQTFQSIDSYFKLLDFTDEEIEQLKRIF